MTIIPFEPAHRPQFETMLLDYFNELSSGIPESVIRERIMELFLGEQNLGIIQIAITLNDDIPIGFSVYQIDTPKSDWCKRPGWGSIREFYIRPDFRCRGLGTELAAWTERELRKMGAQHLYLTADDAIPFWQHCGYSKTNEFCSNELEILTK